MKKRIILVVSSAVLITCLAAPAVFAHNGHGRQVNQTGQRINQNPLCNATYCNQTENHTHNGIWYSGHHGLDGHTHVGGNNQSYGKHQHGHGW